MERFVRKIRIFWLVQQAVKLIATLVMQHPIDRPLIHPASNDEDFPKEQARILLVIERYSDVVFINQARIA